MGVAKLARNYYISYSAAAVKRVKPQHEQIELPDQFELYESESSYALFLRENTLIYCDKQEWDHNFPEYIFFNVIGADEAYVKERFNRVTTLKRVVGKVRTRWVMLGEIPDIITLRDINRLFPSV